MSTNLPAPAPRQAAVLAAIASLHVGAFVLVAAGLKLPTGLFREWEQPVHTIPPSPVPTQESRPDPVGPVDYTWEPVQEPHVPFPERHDPPPAKAGIPGTDMGRAGSGPALAAPDFHGPALRTRDARLQALIDSCYPSGARRQGQEGRGVAHIVVDATGHASGWSVQLSTGFAQLDAGMGCVARRLQFEPGRRDGRAVEATVLMPISFRLD